MEDLRFTVVHCSSTDGSHPVTNLEAYERAGDAIRGRRGWRSDREPRYPVEVGLQFEGRARLRTIELLAHECLVSQFCEFFVGSPVGVLSGPRASQYHDCVWTKLGYTRFGSNRQSNYKARELRTVQVDAGGHFLRLRFHKPHPCALSAHRQVALRALSVLGELEDEDGIPSLAPTHMHNKEVDMALIELGLNLRDEQEVVWGDGQLTPTRPARTPSPEPELHVRVGSLPGRQHIGFFDESLRSLRAEKDQAVSSEDYDAARVLKVGFEELQRLSVEVEKCELRKDGAVQVEDYDRAEQLKGLIDGHVSQAHSLMQQLRLRHEWVNIAPPVPLMDSEALFGSEPVRMGAEVEWGVPAEASGGGQAQQTAGGGTVPLPAAGLGLDPVDPQLLSDMNLPPPEPLDGATAAAKQSLIEIFGKRNIECLCSKQLEQRVAGLRGVGHLVKTQKPLDKLVMLKAVIEASLPSLQSGEETELLSALGLVHSARQTLGARLPPAAAREVYKELLAALVERTHDGSQPIRNAVSRACLQTAGIGTVHGPDPVVAALLGSLNMEKAAQSDAAVESRISLLGTLLPHLQLPDAHGASADVEGPTSAEAMEVLLAGLANESPEIREAAMEASVAAFGRMGRARVEPFVRAAADAGKVRPEVLRVLELNWRDSEQAATRK